MIITGGINLTNYSLARITEDIKRELANILRSVKDYRVNNSMVSIIKVELTRDLSFAKVFVSSILGTKETTEAVEGLKSAAGFIRQKLNSKIHIRKSPELIFLADMSAEYSELINKKLDEISKDKNETNSQ